MVQQEATSIRAHLPLRRRFFLYTLEISHSYPDYLISVRSLVRLPLAALLYYLWRGASLQYDPG